MGHLAFDAKGKVRKGTPDSWLPVAAQVAAYARSFAGRGDIVANVGPGIGGPYATACWTPGVADMDVNTETCLPGYVPEKVDFSDKIFQLGALPFVGAVTHEAAHARWTCWVPGDLAHRREAGYEKWTQATVEVVIALEESRIERLAVTKDPAKRAALAQCALSIVLNDFKVNNTLFGASISLALTVGRYAILSTEEVDRFRTLVAPHLPLGLMPKLEALIREYHALPAPLAKDGAPDDAFFAAMYSIAERWLIAIRETAAKVEAIQEAARKEREEREEREAAEAAERAEAEDADEAEGDGEPEPETEGDSAYEDSEDAADADADESGESDDAYEGGDEPDEDDEDREGPESGDGEPGAGGTDDGAGEGAGTPSDTGTGTPPEGAESHEDGEPTEAAEDGQDEPESADSDADDDSDADGSEGGSEPSEDAEGDGEGDPELDGDKGDESDDTDVREYGTPDRSEPAEDDEDEDETDAEDEGAPESGTGRYDEDGDVDGDGYDDDEESGESDEGLPTDEPAEPEPKRDPREEQPDLRSGIPGEDEEGQTVIVIVLTDGDEDGDSEAADESEGETGGSLADEIREAAGEAAMDREGEALDERAEAETERKVEDRRADRARREEAAEVAERQHGEGKRGFSHFCASHKMEARKPEPGERVAANRLASMLERITFHDRAVTKVDRVVPGGKLRPRAAVARAADRDRGGRADIPIWRAKERRHTAETPVTVGIMNDVSGSMGGNALPAAVTTYVVSQAVGTIEGKVATAAFGSSGYLVNRAYERSPMVQPWVAMDGTEAFREGALLIDAELNLLDGDGARILIIFTDSELVNPDDEEYARTFMRLCKQKNVAVVWCSYRETPISNYGHGAVLNLSGTAADIANTLGEAILREVSKVEATRGA